MLFQSLTDEEIKDAAREKFRALLRRKSFMERWQPFIAETLWVLLGRQNEAEHVKLLPDYCYKIIELHRRTVFKTMHPAGEVFQIKNPEKLAKCKTWDEAKEFVIIDWEKAGIVSGAIFRTFQFIEKQMEGKLRQIGIFDLSENEIQEFTPLIAADSWCSDQLAKIQAQAPGKSVEEILESWLNQQVEAVNNLGPLLEKAAYEWGPEALAQLKKGEARGTVDFLDAEGNVRGERKIKKFWTYLMLLTAWPEIEAMLNANPPKRMEDLWNWLELFSHAGLIEIQDFDQFVALCRPLKLRLKKPGAPRKAKEC